MPFVSFSSLTLVVLDDNDDDDDSLLYAEVVRLRLVLLPVRNRTRVSRFGRDKEKDMVLRYLWTVNDLEKNLVSRAKDRHQSQITSSHHSHVNTIILRDLMIRVSLYILTECTYSSDRGNDNLVPDLVEITWQCYISTDCNRSRNPVRSFVCTFESTVFLSQSLVVVLRWE